MIDSTLRDTLIAVYAAWLDQDSFGHRYVGVLGPSEDTAVTSVRQFLGELLRLSSGPNARVERPAALEHPDSTFMQLLGSPLVTQDGHRGIVEALALDELCLRVIPRLMLEGFGNQYHFDGGARTSPDPPTARRISSRPLIDDPSDRASLADALMEVLKRRLGPRTIRSFFTVDFADHGYRLWEPQSRAPKDSGATLARHIVRTDVGVVAIDLMRYPGDEEASVRAYEWCAELRVVEESEQPDAVAYGMAYRFERAEGIPIGGKWDLMTAADCLADVDLLQVSSFLAQHPDAEALMDEGDLAFVWLWERRSGSRPGAGQACLRAALTDLRRRLRHIRTVVIDLKPYQYVVSDSAGTPTILHIEKLEAVDRLQSFVDALHLDQLVKGHCRYIVNRDGDDPNAAMRVLGREGLAQRGAHWLGGG